MKSSPLLILMQVALLLLSGCAASPDRAPRSDSAKEGSQPGTGADPRFTVVTVDIRTERLELFLRDDAGLPFKSFDRLKSWLANRNERLRFAMNAGMFQADLSPVGLLVQDGQEVSSLNLSDGTGNFFLKPNGVFFIADSGPKIVESSEYPAFAKNVRWATQSGPLLVRNGMFHPAIDPASTSRLLRNGVGVSGNMIVFVITEQPVSFYELAVFFRDQLHCPDALYLDGVVSSLYSMDLQRNDSRADLGPIFAVVG
jgi:uncharacterized protein YigE (DUF2233 family)